MILNFLLLLALLSYYCICQENSVESRKVEKIFPIRSAVGLKSVVSDSRSSTEREAP